MLDRESRRQRRRWGFGFGLTILFLMSMTKSCTELKYSMWGVETQARVTRATEFEDKDSREKIRVKYSFQDEGGTFHENLFSLPASRWVMPEDRMLDIIYLPGSPSTNTLIARRDTIWIYVFLGMLTIFTLWLIKIIRDANAGRLG